MHVKGILDEDFINYKVPSMHIGTCRCSFKCDKENGESCCQNSSLVNMKTITISDDEIINRYLTNDITKAICFAGLEPIDQFDELIHFIKLLRNKYKCDDEVVIFTGYNKDEITEQIEELKKFKNIVMKYGRFIPREERRLDKVLGVYLASPNQYGEVLS